MGMRPSDVGIGDLHVYVPPYSLSLDDLAAARGVDPAKYRNGLGVETMAIAPPWEDAVTLAANAAEPLFTRGAIGRDEIGLLVVATESAVDHAKPVSIFVHELLGIHSACRTYEVKHACYGGTAALMTAAQWIASGAARGRKALVIASDIARYELGSAGEPTQGAGAVAIVVSDAPALLAIDFRASGSFAQGVFDFWRPLDRREALVDGKHSIDCYLRALDGALDDYRQSSGTALELERFRAYLYHTPFPKMAWKAHRRLVDAIERPDLDEAGKDALARMSYEEAVSPFLAAGRQVGNTYTASLYFCLATLLEQYGASFAGERIALFSYGSGCCAEFFSAIVGPGAGAARTGLAAALDGRRPIRVEEYEAIRRAGEPNGTLPTSGGRFFFKGAEDERRRYATVGG